MTVRSFPRRAYIDGGEEDQLLQKSYRKKGPQWCAKKLGRTEPSVRHRADHLGLTKPIWSPREVQVLKLEWGLVSEKVLRMKLKGRSWTAISTKAKRMKLEDPQQGCWTIEQAVIRSGLGRATLMRAFAHYGVIPRLAVRKYHVNRKGADVGHYRRRVVETDDVLTAVKAWLNREVPPRLRVGGRYVKAAEAAPAATLLADS